MIPTVFGVAGLLVAAGYLLWRLAGMLGGEEWWR